MRIAYKACTGALALAGLGAVLCSAQLGVQPPAPSPAETPAVTSAELHAAERACDRSIREYGYDSSVEAIIPTHGARVEGYGVVFVADVNMAPLPLLYGFGGSVNKRDLANVHEAKRKKTGAMRAVAIKMLGEAAKSLPHLGDDQMVVVKIGFFYLDFEDRSGLPDSLTAQARKRDAIEFAAGRLTGLDATARIQVRVDAQ